MGHSPRYAAMVAAGAYLAAKRRRRNDRRFTVAIWLWTALASGYIGWHLMRFWGA